LRGTYALKHNIRIGADALYLPVPKTKEELPALLHIVLNANDRTTPLNRFNGTTKHLGLATFNIKQDSIDDRQSKSIKRHNRNVPTPFTAMRSDVEIRPSIDVANARDPS
jgi:hypothetical protein